MIALIILAAIALWFLINMALTGIAIWSVNEIFNFDMPFWPVFWLLIVVGAVVRAGTTTSSKS